MRRTGRPTEKAVRILFALSGNACAFPQCPSVIVANNVCIGDICHIRAHHPLGPRYEPSQTDAERHAIENLILLCCNHHREIDRDPATYTTALLLKMKAVHEAKSARPPVAADGPVARALIGNLMQVHIGQNDGAVVVAFPGAAVHVRVPKSRVQILPPPGTIGADGDRLRYCEYLVKRYNHFAASEPSRASKFSYGVVRKQIEQKFGANMKLLPNSRFPAVCDFLQQKILRTRIGKQNGAKGHRSYSTFEEYLAGDA